MQEVERSPVGGECDCEGILGGSDEYAVHVMCISDDMYLQKEVMRSLM